MDWINVVKEGQMCIVDLLPAAQSQHSLFEAVAAVRHITATKPAPYTLMLSGGVDSQAMLYAWCLSGAEFKVATITYDSHNEHDLKTLQRFIDINHLPVKVNYLNLDILKFLENEYLNYANKYSCSSPQICTHMKMCELINDGTLVFSGNYVMPPELGGPALSYAILGIMRYAQIEGRSIVPFFFLSTPTLAYSFIKHCRKLDETNPYLAKVSTYKAAGYPVIKQDAKYTGFEKIKELYDEQADRITVRDRVEFSSKPSKRVFDLLFRYPLEKQINDPRIVYKYSFLEKQKDVQ